MKKVRAKQLQQDIIANNYCSGCGVCTALDKSPFAMQMNENGQYLPVQNVDNSDALVVCPFAGHDTDETQIAKPLFQNNQSKFDENFGFYQNIYAGFVKEGTYRENGSSGGSVTWLTQKLLQNNMVDYVINVSEQDQAEIRFNYQVSNDLTESIKGAKSKYYPVNMEAALQFVKTHKGRYAIVGLPCFIKGLRLLQQSEKIFAERIVYTISIFCGHLKTTHYLTSLLSQFPVDIQQVTHFDFRHKVGGQKASNYATKIKTVDNQVFTKNNSELFGTDWGLGLFKLKACDYCDDIIGETADISFGDAWIPKFENDYLGTNMVVSRNAELDALIQQHINEGNLQYEKLSPDELLQSQAGGFRHRREGLAYRLYLQEKKGNYYPKKRIKPKKIKSKKRRKIYRLRMKLQEISFYSKNYRDIPALQAELLPMIKQMENQYGHSSWTKFRLKLKKWLKKK